MTDNAKPTGFWQTVPGILTAFAAIITAVAGLLLALYQAGLLSSPTPPQNANSPNAASPATTAQSGQTAEVDRSQLDISGTWHDNHGTVYYFRQEGERVEFNGNFGSLAFQGSGTLIGRKLTTTFSRSDGSYGNGWGTVSADGKKIDGGSEDNLDRRSSGTMTRDP